MKYLLQVFNLLLSLFFFVQITFEQKGNDYGAYKEIPNSDSLEYRLGNSLEGLEDKYYILLSDLLFPDLCKIAGYNGLRMNFSKVLLEKENFNESCLNNLIKNNEKEIIDIVGYLITKPYNSKEKNYLPNNLYEPIWEKNEKNEKIINEKNEWANYVYKIVSTYNKYIKIWEVWESPDYVDNKEVVKNWMISPPNPSDLIHTHFTIYEYIRLIRITYEVVKNINPESWVSVGGLIYPEFLHAIMRYTDNPDNGTISNEYPAFGGAYFDCVSYNSFPAQKVIDFETNETYNNNGSDALVLKVLIQKKNYEFISKKFEFGLKYPKKIFINNKNGLNSEEGNKLGGDILRRNWIIKLALLSLEYDLKQVHMNKLTGDMGDYQEIIIGNKSEYNNYLKSSSKGRRVLNDINLGKFSFDKNKSIELREKLIRNISGIVLKRKFNKTDNEKYFCEYIYSVWLYCDKEETEGTIYKTQKELNIPFNSFMINWEGLQTNITNETQIPITSTPIFILVNISNESDEPDKEEYE